MAYDWTQLTKEKITSYFLMLGLKTLCMHAN